MCGIAGIISPDIQEKDKVIHDMVSCILHRGPDQDGFFVDEKVGLGMRRLSIIDLSTGKQPIVAPDGKSLIFFNGEIYNYLELRAELEAKGVVFKTHGDTEVILQMYNTYGPESVRRLRGMFAFCIYDMAKGRLFIARDFFGIKPLYYWKVGNQIAGFASEIKSFLKAPGFKAAVNDAAVYNYLSFQYNPLDETFFKDVFKLPPGHWMDIDLATQEAVIKKYWQFQFRKDEKLEEKRTAEAIRATMEDSVAHHMIADVPVGSFLSGGVDSSIIATLMQKVRGTNKIKTFTIGWDTLTEGREASETSDYLDTDHTEIKIGPQEYFDILPKAVWHFDEPVADPSAIGLYFVSREARKHVTVVLSGEGADELFGGYNIYLAPFARAKLLWLPRWIVNAALALPFNYFGKNYLRRVSQNLEDWYIGNASIFKEGEIKQLWKGVPEAPVSLRSLYREVEGQSDSSKMQYIDIHTWLVGDILAKADKMTMANSLELRVPFLDMKVAELAETLPDRFKWRGGVTKYLLREAFRAVIPESTRNRKKLGFPTPIKAWLDSSRQDIYDTILKNEYIATHFDLAYIRRLINDQVSKKTDNTRKIYLLLMLALWYEIFITKSISF